MARKRKKKTTTGQTLFTVLKYTLPFCILFSLYSCKKMRALPELSEIDDQLLQEPVQNPINGDPFTFDYRGQSYLVEPMRFYEIWGLVVTHNDISSITDAYHTSDSVDVKDVCVVWGANLESDIYQKPKYWSAPWTCFYQVDNRADHLKFDGTALSNTHLLSQKEDVRERLKEITVGDQIRMRGMLINYADARYPEYMRDSSLVRTDTGNGACEVMMVDEVEVIKEGSPGWRRAHKLAKNLSSAGVIAFPLLWLFNIFAEQKRIDRELAQAKKRARNRFKNKGRARS